ncbi:CAP domain-containing protein [Gigaspora rosea]|uniref:CAP domain-containing protein n=1 Tax=Gigaspora rosea TaxID=44941 RepID=A0A397TWU2_9GLOM|nr:CAP domain-containing protein [Gigaspora rosea]
MKSITSFLVVALMLFNVISVQCMDEQKMLDLVNTERRKAGVSPITLNSDLCSVAQDHSDFMSKNNILTHDDPAGSLGNRFTQHGYSFSNAGENVAEGFKDEVSVMKGWMNSPGHRANILSSKFKEGGFAQSGKFWTQDFGTQSGGGSGGGSKSGSKSGNSSKGSKSSTLSLSSTKKASKQLNHDHTSSTNKFNDFANTDSFENFVDSNEDTPKKTGHFHIVHKHSKKRRLNYD